MRTRIWPFVPFALIAFGLVAGCDTPTPKPEEAAKPAEAEKPTENTASPEADQRDAKATKDPDMLPVDPRLKIEDVKVGTGQTAKPGRLAYVKYKGTLVNGTVFDSNTAADKDPFAFQVGAGQVIRGWDQGVQGMKVGGIRKLEIPPDLAYGKEGQGPIPANATLRFEIELLEVLKPEDRNSYEVTVIKPGTGPKPKKGDTVTLEYTGRLINGKQFDTSKGRAPLTFTVGNNEVVSGFDAGVREMQAGGTYKLWIGPDAAYGAIGKPPTIPANSILVFDVELKSIKRKG